MIIKLLKYKANFELKKLDPNYKTMPYDKKNAFEHAYVSGFIANVAGEDCALIMGYQKEIHTQEYEITHNSADIAFWDTNRDLWNNQKGIEYSKECSSNKELARRIYDNINKGSNSDFITNKNDKRKWKENTTIENLWDEIKKERNISFEKVLKKYPSININDLMWNRDVDMPEGMINDLYGKYNGYRGKFWNNSQENFKKAGIKNCNQEDPLIFDLNNDGIISTTNIYNGVYFDHENDGFAEASAWVGKNDGILVVDTNNNGEIDNGTELVTADNIAEYDTNEDGIIDSNDINFNNLKILKGDGTLLTLAEAGIASINLSTTQVGIPDENGNEQVYEATFTRTDGTTGKYGEFLVNTETSNSIAIEWLDETEEISELPDIDGNGKMYSLHQAMLRDVSGDLQELVEDFVSETDDSVRQSLVDQILYKWAEVGAINPSSRGVYVNAQHLSVLEAFMGRIFASHAEPVDGSCECGEHCYCNEPNMPNPQQGQMLETAYLQLRTNIYAELMSQTHNSNLLEDIEFGFDTEKQQFVFNLDAVTTQLQQAIAQDAVAGKTQAVQFVTTLKGLGLEPYSNYFDPFDDNCLYTALTQNDRELKWQFDTIGKIPFVDETGEGEGTAGDDYFRAESGEESNFHALIGDDVMYGDNQTDHFAACSGNDLLDGGDGDDVLDSHGGNDIIFAGAGNDIIHASDGDDIIFGDAGDDIIYPDHGDDFSYAEDGDDIIRGGTGNDTIISMVGNDTFIFNLGDGQDTIIERQGVDTLYFGTGIEWEDLIFTRDDDDMVISIDGTTDQITVKDWFLTSGEDYQFDNNKIEIFKFADDDEIHYKDEILVGNNTESVLYNMADLDNDYFELPSNYKTTINLKAGWNHIVEGSNSNDTFVLSEEGTNVLIQNYSGENTIQFGQGITLANTVFEIDEEGLQISFKDFDAHITIQGDLDADTSIEFYDETVITDIKDYIRRDVSYSDYTMHTNQEELTLLGSNDINAVGNNLDNIIRGNYGDTTFEGAGGNDRLESEFGGDDTYIYNVGDDWDWIVDIGGTDTIRFGQGITVQDVVFRNNHNNLDIKVKVEDNHGGISVEGYFKSIQKRIERFEFADGTVLTDLTNYITGITVDTDYTIAENSQIRDLFLKGNGDLSVVGNSDDNEFSGNLGNNTYQGNGGNDSFYDDQGGNDTYIYNLGDGFDFITDIGGSDTIRFGQGITTSNLRMKKQDEGNLEIYFEGEEGSIIVDNYFNDNDYKIEKIILSDNTEITDFTPYFTFVETDTNYTLPANNNIVEDIIATGNGNISLTGNDNDNNFVGNSGNNTFQGNGGDDNFYDDQGGNDTYIYNLGDGYDSIHDEAGVDTILFGQGITVDDVDFHRGLDGLGIHINKENYDGNIWIDNFFDPSNTNKIERIEFYDGTVITDVTNYITSIDVDSNYTIAENSQIHGVNIQGDDDISVTGNSEDNHFNGNSGDNTYQGNGGNDNFYDEQGGDDTYIYNLGDGFDFITDIGGADTICFGQGITTSNLRMRKQDNGNLEIYFDGEEGNIVIQNYFNNNDNRIEKIVLSDNTEITNFTPYFTFVETDTNYTMPSNSIVEDVIATGNGNISLTGNSNNNNFYGNSGNNTYQGNGGDDRFTDIDGGNDTYIYNIGDGNDYIIDNGGNDTISFGQGITTSNIAFMQTDDHLNIFFGDNIAGNITVENYWDNQNKRIENFVLSDNTTITDISNYIKSIGSNNNIVLQNNAIHAHLWGTGNISATGSSSDNWFWGNSGNNTYQGNGGNDHFFDDQGGDDTYIYNLGDGNDSIQDNSGNDIIRFGQGITTANLLLRRDSNGNLLICFDGEDGSILVENYFNNNDNKIEKIVLSDNTEITNFTPYFTFVETDTNYTIPANSIVEDVYATGSGNISLTGNANDNHFFGNSGNNTFQGNGGNDNFHDVAGGNDTYIYNLGDGNDYINDLGGNDTLTFGSGITLNNLAFMQTSDNLNIWFQGLDGGITIENYFTNQNKRIENFVLSDNTIITDISNYITAIGSEESIVLPNGIAQAHLWGTGNISATGNSMDNWIGGNSGNNTIEGKGGNDYIWDNQGGNDTYIYNLGDGNDFIHDEYGSDTIQFGQGISTSDVSFVHHSSSDNLEVNIGNNGMITIENYFSSDVNKIETFEFADNSVITNITSLITEINDSQPQNSPELEPLGELEPLDVNQLIQEMNSYGVDNEVLMTNTQNQNEELLLVMGS